MPIVKFKYVMLDLIVTTEMADAGRRGPFRDCRFPQEVEQGGICFLGVDCWILLP